MHAFALQYQWIGHTVHLPQRFYWVQNVSFIIYDSFQRGEKCEHPTKLTQRIG